MPPTDPELLERIEDDRTGDSLRTLYRRYSDELYGFAYQALGDRGAADEVVQDVFTSVWRNANTYDERRGSFRPKPRYERRRCGSNNRSQSATARHCSPGARTSVLPSAGLRLQRQGSELRPPTFIRASPLALRSARAGQASPTSSAAIRSPG